MTSKELKEAFINDSPVFFKGAQYAKIVGIGFRKEDKTGKIIETATLADLCGRSEVTVLAKDIELCS